MCCLFTILVFLGPRFGAIFWWIVQPLRWSSTFDHVIVPILGLIFLPWTLLMAVVVAPGGIEGFDWIWIGLAVAVDLFSWFGGGYGNRYQLYEYVPAAANPSVMPPTEPPVAPSKAAEAAVEAPAVPVEAPVSTTAPTTEAPSVPPLPDDLLVIDGVGPKIDAALKAVGVKTFAQIADMTPDQLREILKSANVPVVGNKIETWPHQARLAARQDWPALIRFIAQSKMRVDATDDLQVLDGIGPKIDATLKAAGVKKFDQLAEMTPDQLRAILEGAGVPVIGSSIETWPHQARLAAAEDWPGLIRFIVHSKNSPPAA